MRHERLDPVRLRPPRPGTLLRYAVVAALLTAAAGLLYTGPAACPVAPAGRTATTTGSPPTGSPAATAGAPAPHRTPAASAGVASGGPHKPRVSAPPALAGDPAALPVPSGAVGVPVQLAEPATAMVLRPGDRVDLIARSGSPEDPPAAGTVVLARDVLVLWVTGSAEAVVYLAMSPERARQVSRLSPEVALGVTVRPR